VTASAFALFVSLVAAVAASVSALLARRARRHAEELARRYAEAIAVVAFVARADPPIAAPELRAVCERVLADHHVDVTFETLDRGRVH
jgi:hypothetical protein